MKSLLRYPGGKSLLADDIINMLGKSDRYLEGFVGGGAVALNYALRYPDAEIILNDLNPRVAAFWKCLSDPLLFPSFVDSLPVLVDVETFRQHVARTEGTDIDLAVSLYVTNKCAFNGYVHTASVPIGGWDQKSEYKVDWCWKKDKMVRALTKAHNLFVGRTKVVCRSVFDIKFKDPSNVVAYFDPPYIQEGEGIYREFGGFDHEGFARHLRDVQFRWVLSYDDDPRIRDWFSYAEMGTADVFSSRKRVNQKELIIRRL